MPTELELIALDTEFNLYLPFSKRLVLDLPNPRDRARAAQWLQFLRQVSNDNMMKLRNEHLKLLLFALHRRAMVGIFGVKPPQDELESFHDGLTLLEMTRELIELTEKKSSGDGDDKTVCPLPPVWTNFSFDLKEYSAMQHIPKFGAHVYYAVSSEPIQMWKKSPNGVYPAMGDIPNTMQWEQRLSQITDHVLEKEAEVDRKMEVMKLIEKGEATEDDLEPPQDPSKKPRIETCKGIVFKWKKNSILQLYQKYDFTEIKDIDNLLKTGTEQLELDEDAFDFMNRNLPGRQKIYVREPYFAGLPKDIIERKSHGVEDALPEDNIFADLFPDECGEAVKPKPICPMGRISPKRFGCEEEQVSEEETDEDSCEDDQNSCCNQEDPCCGHVEQNVNPCCQHMNNEGNEGNECNVLFDNSGFDDTCCPQNQNETVISLCQMMEQSPCGERPRTAEPYGASEINPCDAMRPRTADCCAPQRVESGLCQNHGGPPNVIGMYGGPQESHDPNCQCESNQMNGSMRKPRTAPRNDTINAGCESHNNIQANRCQSQASVNSGQHAASCMRNAQRQKSQISIQTNSTPSCRHSGGTPAGSSSNFRRPQSHRGVPDPQQPVQDMNFYPMIHHNQKHCIQGQYEACCPFCKSVSDLSK